MLYFLDLKSLFNYGNNARGDFFSMKYNGGNMASGGLRATSLSAVTNLEVGQKVSNYHLPRHWLYCVLGCVCFIIHLINNKCNTSDE